MTKVYFSQGYNSSHPKRWYPTLYPESGYLLLMGTQESKILRKIVEDMGFKTSKKKRGEMFFFVVNNSKSNEAYFSMLANTGFEI